MSVASPSLLAWRFDYGSGCAYGGGVGEAHQFDENVITIGRGIYCSDADHVLAGVVTAV